MYYLDVTRNSLKDKEAYIARQANELGKTGQIIAIMLCNVINREDDVDCNISSPSSTFESEVKLLKIKTFLCTLENEVYRIYNYF